MSDTIFGLHSWPQAIVQIDGDAFFTSCEEAIHPKLRGKPIITGVNEALLPVPVIPLKGLVSNGAFLCGRLRRFVPV